MEGKPFPLCFSLKQKFEKREKKRRMKLLFRQIFKLSWRRNGVRRSGEGGGGVGKNRKKNVKGQRWEAEGSEEESFCFLRKILFNQ